MLSFVYAQKALPRLELRTFIQVKTFPRWDVRKLVTTVLKCSQHKYILKVMDLSTLLNQSLNYNCRANFHLLNITINTVSQQGLTRGPAISLLAAFSVVHCLCSSDRSSRCAEQNTEYHTYHHRTEPKQLYKHLERNLSSCAATSAHKRCRNVKKTQFEAIGFWGKEDLPWTHQRYQWSQFTQTWSPPHCTSRVFKLTCVCYTALQLSY